MNEQDPAPGRSSGLVGRSYTRARRHPWVIGKIQGWTLPLGPFTATQLGTLVVGLWLLVQTAPWWSGLGPLAAVPISAPFAATWAVRHATIEGRAPLRALGGVLALLTAPRSGWMHGSPLAEPRPVVLTGLLTIAADPPSGSAPPSGRPRVPDLAAGSSPTPAVKTAPAPRAVPGEAPRPSALQALLADLELEEE